MAFSEIIRAARILEDRIKFWDIAPLMDLLSNREGNGAYVGAKPGAQYALYFTNGGSCEAVDDRHYGNNIAIIGVGEYDVCGRHCAR